MIADCLLVLVFLAGAILGVLIVHVVSAPREYHGSGAGKFWGKR